MVYIHFGRYSTSRESVDPFPAMIKTISKSFQVRLFLCYSSTQKQAVMLTLLQFHSQTSTKFTHNGIVTLADIQLQGSQLTHFCHDKNYVKELSKLCMVITSTGNSASPEYIKKNYELAGPFSVSGGKSEATMNSCAFLF